VELTNAVGKVIAALDETNKKTAVQNNTVSAKSTRDVIMNMQRLLNEWVVVANRNDTISGNDNVTMDTSSNGGVDDINKINKIISEGCK
jgi:hypothetical protein